MVPEYISYYRALSVGLCVGAARNVADGSQTLFLQTFSKSTNVFQLYYMLYLQILNFATISPRTSIV